MPFLHFLRHRCIAELKDLKLLGFVRLPNKVLSDCQERYECFLKHLPRYRSLETRILCVDPLTGDQVDYLSLPDAISESEESTEKGSRQEKKIRVSEQPSEVGNPTSDQPPSRKEE